MSSLFSSNVAFQYILYSNAVFNSFQHNTTNLGEEDIIMNLSTLLCVLFSKLDGEKTANAALHLLRGKRSGQTIQDVKYYDLKMFFGLLPKLPQQLLSLIHI